MTAVIGILNKRGIAIAADSAVTIRNDRNVKIENSANKMLRLSDVNPMSVMIVGSAAFLNTYWDIIIRRYRQKRGQLRFPTVQACIDDFFSYMLTEKIFFPEEFQKNYLKRGLRELWDGVVRKIPDIKVSKSGKVTNGRQIIHAFQNRIKSEIKFYQDGSILPMYKDYTLKQFKEYLGSIVDDLFKKKTLDIDPILFNKDLLPPGKYTEEILSSIKEPLIEGLFSYMISDKDDGQTHLIFSGYGDEEEYPAMIRVLVSNGFDHRICYHIEPKDVHIISDDNPVAICPYAQTDIMEALLTGVIPSYNRSLCDDIEKMYCDIIVDISLSFLADGNFEEIDNILKKVKKNDLIRQFKQYADHIREAERRQWLKALQSYSLQDMAHLAENLIAMTSFERHMTFSQEGVGGPIDVAVITKNDGFVWLNRKSWYHHKDVGGRYGKFGV